MAETGSRPLRVAIVEDDCQTREALVGLVHGTPGFTCLGDWSSVGAERPPAASRLAAA